MGPQTVSARRSHWNIPHHLKNKNFVGRDTFIADLNHHVHTAVSNRIFAIHGMAGIGKTQIVYEYIRTFKDQYDLIYWMSAEDETLALKDFIGLGEKLKLPIDPDQEQRSNLELVKNWLGANERWLLVFDNMDDPKLLQTFLPDEVRGNILLTSRNPNWMHAAEPIELGLLDPDYSALYLQQRSGVSDPAAALQLANLLGNLPLALEQAGAYIEATRCSLADYIEEYNKYKSKLLQLFQPYNYNFTVVKVTELALERIRDSKPDALCLLNAMSFLHPEDIPKDLFVQDDTDLELEHYPIRDSLTLNSYIYELRRFSIIHADQASLSMHRLIQEIVRAGLPESQQRETLRLVLRLLETSTSKCNETELEITASGERLVPHLVRATEHALQMDQFTDQAIDLMTFLGQYFTLTSNYEKAIHVYEETIDWVKKSLGEQYEGLIDPYSGLAFTYYRMAQYAKSESLYQQALQLISRSKASNEYATYNHYGLLLLKTNRFPEARTFFIQALRGSRKKFGKKSLQTVNINGNYAELLLRLDQNERGLEILNQNIKLLQDLYSDKHPSIATCHILLGQAYSNLHRFNEQEQHCRLALGMDEELFGREHPKVATDCNNLGLALINQEQYDEALAYFKRCYRIDRQYLDMDHPKIAVRLCNVGLAYNHKGKHRLAIKFYRKSLAINQKAFPDGSLEAATQLVNIGTAYQSLGKTTEAIEYLEQGLAMEKKFYKSDHSELAKSYLNLGFSYCMTRLPFYLDKAVTYFNKALRIYEKKLAPGHPLIKQAVECLLVAYELQKDFLNFTSTLTKYRSILN